MTAQWQPAQLHQASGGQQRKEPLSQIIAEIDSMIEDRHPLMNLKRQRGTARSVPRAEQRSFTPQVL